MERFEGCIGVDGAKGQWIAVSVSEGQLAHQVHANARALVEAHRAARVIAVDIPIGLSDHGRRQADVDARAFVGGKRRSSIFSSPVRGILDARSQQEASRRHREIDTRGFGAQSFAILDKIRQWDSLLQEDAQARRTVHEVHPEVSFAALGGTGGIQAKKQSAEGLAIRIGLLAGVFGQDRVEALLQSVPRRQAAPDDVLDALVALWSAERIGSGRAVSLPCPVVADRTGLPAAIWY